MTAQRTLFDAPERQRRTAQIVAIRALMADFQWRTFAEIVAALKGAWAISASESGVSARLRQIRGEGQQVDAQARAGHLYEYRVWPQTPLQRKAE